jgi:hypothetical protein
MKMSSLVLAAATLAMIGSFPCLSSARGDVQLERRNDRVDVSLDGVPFTSLVFTGHPKPILFPILGPRGVPMTRSWPMVGDVAGESHDHPHHESLWFMHGSVNGIDFWGHPADQQGRRPRVEQTDITRCESGETGVLETVNRWCGPDGTVICTDTRRIEFSGDATSRSIDYAITIRADHGPVTLGDTKEGTMAVRVRTSLQVKDREGSVGAAGHIVNSEGEKDVAAWGKKARWVDFSGPADGRTVGIAILDHPANLRHPTHWHARDYGLFAANPFGLHDFTGSPAGSGDHTIPAGESLTLRYRFIFHEGDAVAAGIEDCWRRWAEKGTH